MAGEIFVPASTLADLRRQAFDTLESTHRMRYERDYRLSENRDTVPPMGTELSYHDNVSNRLAQQFYVDHGVTKIKPALEVRQPEHELTVMTTRYCIRRELGCCLKTSNAKKLPSTLFIASGHNKFRLDFDCKNCRMKVVKV